MKNIVLIGNFGVGNFGDEAIVEFYKRFFNHVHFRIVSHNPKLDELHRLPLGVRSFFTPWYKTIFALFKTDAVIVGGGTLFTDSESLYACFLWWYHIIVPFVLGKPIHLCFQGIGPCTSRISKMLTKSALRCAQTLSVRDMRSLECARSLGISNVTLAFDPVILLLPDSYTNSYTHSCLVIIPRHNSNDSFLDLVKKCAKDQWDEVLILSFHPNNGEEVILTNQLQTLFAQSTIRSITSMDEAMLYIGSASLVLSQRFHGTLIAKALGKTVLSASIAEGDKHAVIHDAMNNLDECRALARIGVEDLRKILQK